jgi:hypothetical protein
MNHQEQVSNAVAFRIWNQEVYNKKYHQAPKTKKHDEWIDVHFSNLTSTGEIDEKLELLKEWVYLKRFEMKNGQIVKFESIRVGDKFKQVTFDIRDFAGFYRYRTRNFEGAAIERILK